MMRDMLKGTKDMKSITPARKMAICKSFNAMSNMMNKVMTCKSAELKAGLMNAKTLCTVKKTGSGSGSGAKKPMTTKKPGSTDSKGCDNKKFKGMKGVSVWVPEKKHGGAPPCGAVITIKKGYETSCSYFCEAQDQHLKCKERSNRKELCDSKYWGGAMCVCEPEESDDFCSGAPSSDMVKICKAERNRCMTSSKDAAKQKACWEAAMKELEE